MGKIIGVHFENNGKTYYFDTCGLEPEVGSYVILDTTRGLDLGQVISGCREAEDQETEPLRKVVRLATEADIQRGRDNRLREREAYQICQHKIAEHRLEMKLVSVEYAFDGSKVLFYFTADGRVDFRSLVKDLASVFKTRIELRQIGVRDEAKMLGGLGPCGRPICCGAFLEQFQPVSIRMAKEQNLSLNPTKISGVCGRLMCCLKYEQDHYEQTRKRMPRVGKEVITPDGPGHVTELNIVKETVSVRIPNGDASEIREYPLEAISRPDRGDHPGRAEEAAPGAVGQSEQMEEGETVDLPASEDFAAEGAPTDSVPTDNAPAEADGDNRPPRPKTRSRGYKGALGQPVRRENPNRSQAQEQAAGEETEHPRKHPARGKDRPEGAPRPVKRVNRGPEKRKPEQPTAEKKTVGQPREERDAGGKAATASGTPEQKPTSSWADAVASAMRAIDKD